MLQAVRAASAVVRFGRRVGVRSHVVSYFGLDFARRCTASCGVSDFSKVKNTVKDIVSKFLHINLKNTGGIMKDPGCTCC